MTDRANPLASLGRCSPQRAWPQPDARYNARAQTQKRAHTIGHAHRFVTAGSVITACMIWRAAAWRGGRYDRSTLESVLARQKAHVRELRGQACHSILAALTHAAVRREPHRAVLRESAWRAGCGPPGSSHPAGWHKSNWLGARPLNGESHESTAGARAFISSYYGVSPQARYESELQLTVEHSSPRNTFYAGVPQVRQSQAQAQVQAQAQAQWHTLRLQQQAAMNHLQQARTQSSTLAPAVVTAPWRKGLSSTPLRKRPLTRLARGARQPRKRAYAKLPCVGTGAGASLHG